MSFLKDLALAHQRHEGWSPPSSKYPTGTVSWRNRNPGNLRLTRGQQRIYGAFQGESGFAAFISYEIGFRALMDDLRAKITGHSRHIDYSQNPTLLTMIKVYAPVEDNNSPTGYTDSLIRQLPQYGLQRDTPLSELSKLIAQDEFVGRAIGRPSWELKRAYRGLKRAVGMKRNQIVRKIKRLLRIKEA